MIWDVPDTETEVVILVATVVVIHLATEEIIDHVRGSVMLGVM